MAQSGDAVLQGVADRIVAAFLGKQGYASVHVIGKKAAAYGSPGVDLTYVRDGHTRRAKVKADPYFGLDQDKIADRELPLYRSDTGSYAFESLSNTLTRELGWTLNSAAEDLFYYYVAIAQPLDEVRALLVEPDEVFFTELAVERDELRLLPAELVSAWFEKHQEGYTPRPVTSGDRVAWYRLVPRGDVEAAVKGIKLLGPVFAGLAP